MRVALPGVQVLFAFLLIVPFNPGFSSVTRFQEGLYLITLMCTAAAALLLIAPTVHHRMTFRRQDKEFIVLLANNLAIAGLGLLAVAMTGALTLISDFILGPVAAAATGVLVAVAFGGVWYAIPLQRRRTR